jgi:uncharacterized phage protein (TIGR01671 family)
MRELKFRIWDTLAKKYISQRHYLSSMKVDDSGIATFTYKQYLDGGFIIQQYTGLKDKNGKEVYEGDIIKLFNGQLYKVEFIEESNEVEMSGYFFSSFGCEVIGNIMENSELLKQ